MEAGWVGERQLMAVRTKMSKTLAHSSRVLICFFAVVFIFVSSSLAQNSLPLVQNVASRKTTSLNGDWHYIADPHEEGTARRYYLNGKPFGSRNFVEYDFNTSSTLRVPGDSNLQRPDVQ